MLNQIEISQANWGGESHLIDRWLAARKRLLVLFCELSGLTSSSQKQKPLPSEEQTLSFCEALVDYVSTGHFEVYDHMLDALAADAHTQKKCQNILPELSQSTDDALAFNDMFTSENPNWKTFDTALSMLGQSMEQRFGLEDILIQALYELSVEQS
ncbi:sigma D regulator [Aestuariibacter sp. AA17]|uniref:Sigma D regulator n=1 Tax=Fluctibacter corallii TaxID=2984329 RepID=A0ABT3AD63_9ALTE|nr:sigma D regulator [Aestuariibacter sp. AA17]MCV2886604.1 sigma D regulator [Aestuariibacter sp. AA17]